MWQSVQHYILLCKAQKDVIIGYLQCIHQDSTRPPVIMAYIKYHKQLIHHLLTNQLLFHILQKPPDLSTILVSSLAPSN